MRAALSGCKSFAYAGAVLSGRKSFEHPERTVNVNIKNKEHILCICLSFQSLTVMSFVTGDSQYSLLTPLQISRLFLPLPSSSHTATSRAISSPGSILRPGTSNPMAAGVRWAAPPYIIPGAKILTESRVAVLWQEKAMPLITPDDNLHNLFFTPLQEHSEAINNIRQIRDRQPGRIKILFSLFSCFNRYFPD